MFNYATFLQLSLMLIVVGHVVSLPSNLQKDETPLLPRCILSDGQHHPSSCLFQFSLLPHLVSNFITSGHCSSLLVNSSNIMGQHFKHDWSTPSSGQLFEHHWSTLRTSLVNIFLRWSANPSLSLVNTSLIVLTVTGPYSSSN